jgi:hypothetical protein
MAFGKGGFVPPVLRRKAEVSNGTGEESQAGGHGRQLPMGAMFGGGFGARRSEGAGAGVEEPTSFDEVGNFIIRGGREGEGERKREGGRESTPPTAVHVNLYNMFLCQ